VKIFYVEHVVLPVIFNGFYTQIFTNFVYE
jgi:hypothetical protein